MISHGEVLPFIKVLPWTWTETKDAMISQEKKFFQGQRIHQFTKLPLTRKKKKSWTWNDKVHRQRENISLCWKLYCLASREMWLEGNPWHFWVSLIKKMLHSPEYKLMMTQIILLLFFIFFPEYLKKQKSSQELVSGKYWHQMEKVGNCTTVCH